MTPYERHRNCPLTALSFDAHGASCAACGLRWVRDRWAYRLASARPAWAASL